LKMIFALFFVSMIIQFIVNDHHNKYQFSTVAKSV
jgi:hypothetical protein